MLATAARQPTTAHFLRRAGSPLRRALGPSNAPVAAHTRSVEQTENALILFYVAAVFPVVTRNADRLHQRAVLAPDTGADDCGSRWQLAGASQFSKLDTHAVERPIKLGDVAPTAIVGSDWEDAEHIGFSTIGGADFAVHL